MKLLNFSPIILSLVFLNSNAMAFDQALDDALDQFDGVPVQHSSSSSSSSSLSSSPSQVVVQSQPERKREVEPLVVPDQQQPGPDFLTPRNSNQALIERMSLMSPQFAQLNNEAQQQLAAVYVTMQERDIATGAALAYQENGNKIHAQQAKIGSHEDRIAILEKLINKFEAALNQAIGGFNQGKKLLIRELDGVKKELDGLKTEIKEIRESIANQATHIAVLDANQENERQRVNRLEQSLNQRMDNLNAETNRIGGILQAIMQAILGPIDTIKNLDANYYTKYSELIFLGSLSGYLATNKIVQTAGGAPIVGLPLKSLVYAVSLPFKLICAANLGLSGYKTAKKHSYIADYKKSIFGGAVSAATAVALGRSLYKGYLQASKVYSEMSVL